MSIVIGLTNDEVRFLKERLLYIVKSAEFGHERDCMYNILLKIRKCGG